MDILVGYGVRPPMERILGHYWDNLSIVARVGCYLRHPIHGSPRGHTGSPLYPTAFNMLVGTVICHWVTLLVGGDAVLDSFGGAVQWLAVFFYANDSLLALPRMDRLQAALVVLMGFFKMVGLHKNLNKMVWMLCQPCYIVVGHSGAAYTRQMTGVVPYVWDQNQERFRCLECELKLAAVFLAAHFHAQNSKDSPPQWAIPPSTLDPRIYRVYFYRASGSIGFPMESCKGQATTHANLRIHFVHRHM